MTNRHLGNIAFSVVGALIATLAVAISVAPATAAEPGITATCYAQSCEGQWPNTTRCANDAFTPHSEVSPEGILVELRYSPTCRAAWGYIRYGIIGDRVRVHSSDGSNYYREITSNSDTFTRMVNDAGLLAWACVRAAYSQTLTCTDEY